MSSLGREYHLEWEMLEGKLRSYGFKELDRGRDVKRGTYVLVCYLGRVSRIKKWLLPKGVYLYVGRAMRNFNARIERHYRKEKSKRWHIDYLLEKAEIIKVFYFENDIESRTAKYLEKFYTPIVGFGNSDDLYALSHLFYIHPLNFIVESFYKRAKELKAPVFQALKETCDPYERFIFVFLSSRTRDEKTLEVTKRFVSKFPNWESIQKASEKEIAKTLYGVAFHNQKAKNIKNIAHILRGRRIPRTYEEMVSLPGIGDKIAKVILADVFGDDVIGVDTHVHRISNRLGLVNTKTPEQTSEQLKVKVPKNIRQKLNISFVGYGQMMCKPLKPLCDKCKIKEFCFYGIKNSISTSSPFSNSNFSLSSTSKTYLHGFMG